MMTKRWFLEIGLGLFACAGAVACTAASGDEPSNDDVVEDVGVQQSAQAKDTAPGEGGKCSAKSTVGSTTVSNGTYTSNGSGGFNCCSKAGPNQVCINCAATGTNTCTSTLIRNPGGVIGPIPTVFATSP
jgi:hypothetical protein